VAVWCVLLAAIVLASCARKPPPIVIGGVTVPTGGTTPVTRALLSSDGRHLIVPVSSSHLGCWDLALAADEQGHRVTLGASATPGTGIGAGCASDAATMENLTATLRTPLWGRHLADGSTGKAVTYFDGRQLYSIGYLPSGYRLQQNTPWLDTWAVAQPTSWRGYNAWVREYVPRGSCPTGTVNVQVSQVKPASVTARMGTGPVRLRTRVNGHPAQVQEGSINTGRSRESVTWTAGGYGFAVAWYGVRSAPCPKLKPLPYSELLRVARSLHR
jgi:hypothetical protein